MTNTLIIDVYHKPELYKIRTHRRNANIHFIKIRTINMSLKNGSLNLIARDGHIEK
jgi:hypothetical protein